MQGQARGPSEQCRFNIIVLSQPCCGLFVEDGLAKWPKDYNHISKKTEKACFSGGH